MNMQKQYDDGLNYSIPYGFFATGITLNVDKLGNDYPRDLCLLDERYKGKMTMLDDIVEVLLEMVLQHLCC